MTNVFMCCFGSADSQVVEDTIHEETAAEAPPLHHPIPDGGGFEQKNGSDEVK
eukprot:CAMPEP_0178930816 /NCGR_PEP_ID=MMETSP0786-20121207/21506_1 /TAXON_ID=186022 /ORGANISM="Thalassionema frauenfeldii, Strain CCMP 1798" /LENGTH=52 /DNA_ID=CAMNT_0020607507 /DNA_START=65 /DNA_END=220 /DNA_ORIENTATION=-